MRFERHHSAACPRCGRCRVWVGLKEEASGWKVFGECECGHTWKAGVVPRGAVDTRDDLVPAAKSLF